MNDKTKNKINETTDKNKNNKLKKQLELYENGDLEALESILTPSIYNQSNAPDEDQQKQPYDTISEGGHNIRSSIGTRRILTSDHLRNRSNYDHSIISGSNRGREPSNLKGREQEQNNLKRGQGDLEQNKRNNDLEKKKNPENDEPIRIVQSEETVKTSVRSVNEDGVETYTEISNSAFPLLTDEIKADISQTAKAWIKLDESLEKLRNAKSKLEKSKKLKEADILKFIETYGLKDITKGKHQLVPKIVKGKRQSLSKKNIQEKISDFLSTLDIGEDPNEIALQACDYLENMRRTGAQQVKLHHTKL